MKRVVYNPGLSAPIRGGGGRPWWQVLPLSELEHRLETVTTEELVRLHSEVEEALQSAQSRSEDFNVPYANRRSALDAAKYISVRRKLLRRVVNVRHNNQQYKTLEEIEADLDATGDVAAGLRAVLGFLRRGKCDP